MKKKFALLVFVVILSVVLVSCDKDGHPPSLHAGAEISEYCGEF